MAAEQSGEFVNLERKAAFSKPEPDQADLGWIKGKTPNLRFRSGVNSCATLAKVGLVCTPA